MATPDPAPSRRSPLWAHRDFMKLWAGDTVSVFGSQLVFFALPLIAVSLLDANAFQMGLLATLESAAFLIISLPAGAWIDRLPKKIVIVSGDIVRAAILLTIPLAWSFGALSMLQLYLVAAGVGIVTVFFDIANQSNLPEIVDGGTIGDGHGKLQASQQTAGVVGPTLASGLVAAIGAPLTVGLTSVCMSLSSLFVSRIRHREAPPEPATRTGFISEIREGLGFVLGHNLLRRITACTGLTNFAASGIFALLVLFVLTTLELSQVQLGIIMSASAIGGIRGALSAASVQTRLGEGTSISVSAMLGGLSFFGMPLATVLPAFPPMLVASLVTGWAVVVYNIAQVSFRQRLCPKPLLGRMNASIRFLVWGPMPLGSLLAGILGDRLGVSTTMWILAACSLAASIPVLVSPLLRMRTLPRELDLLGAASDADSPGCTGAADEADSAGDDRK
ncbi:MAG: MFS transporter [Brevibacterium sp.]|nr:MFS transporter [Brevibacterium sp.]